MRPVEVHWKLFCLEEVNKKLEEALKKGQKDTAASHAQTATETVDNSYKTASKELVDFQNTKNKELALVESGNKDELDKVHKAQADDQAGKDAAAKINAAMQKKNWYGGKSPDKKAIMDALKGADKDQIDAMRESLKAQGINIDDFVRQNMSGGEQNEALIRLTGDPVAGDIAALQNAGGHNMTGNEKMLFAASGIIGLGFVAMQGDKNLGADPKAVEEILKRYPPGRKERTEFR